MQVEILIVDDDQKLGARLQKYLCGFGFRVETASHPADGLKRMKKQHFDLLILDVMMPDIDGFEVCRRVRKDHDLPIIMLTARGDVTDRIVGLELGADDYLPKPFEPRELVARIQSILRREKSGSVKNTASLRTFGLLKINLNNRTVQLNGEPVLLTHLEYEILVLFIKNRGVVLDRDYLLDRIRGIDWDAYNRSIDVLISRLRQKLKEDSKNPKYIKTVWGTGYVFVGEETDGS